jgi:hypothetical protein
MRALYVCGSACVSSFVSDLCLNEVTELTIGAVPNAANPPGLGIHVYHHQGAVPMQVSSVPDGIAPEVIRRGEWRDVVPQVDMVGDNVKVRVRPTDFSGSVRRTDDVLRVAGFL